MAKKILILPGDGIGPEIVAEAVKVLEVLRQRHGLDVEWQEGLIGGAAYDRTGSPLPEETLTIARQADAVLLGAVGGPQWDKLERPLRPEQGGLLGIRSGLGLFANLRPVSLPKVLAHACPLAKERQGDGIDILVVRELTGGMYFGQPKKT